MTSRSSKPNYRVVRSEDGTISVFLYSIRIARTDGSFLILNTDGWQTPTTKRYLNKFFEDFSIPLMIQQINKKWLLHNFITLKTVDFFDNMTINLSEVSS
jgi:hypothetical protein